LLMSHQQKEMAPLVALLDAVTVTRNGDTVNIRADVTQEMLTNPNQARQRRQGQPFGSKRPGRVP